MSKMADIIKQALDGIRAPFSFQTSNGRATLSTEQKRPGEKCSEISYLTRTESFVFY